MPKMSRNVTRGGGTWKAMSEDHPDPHLLERFMRNEADGEERRRIVRHLLAGCARCVGGDPADLGARRRAAGRSAGEADPQPARAAGRAPDERTVGQISRRLAEVLAFSRDERRERIGNDERFQSPALCELLMASSRQAVPPVLAVERAEAAVDVAERLDIGRYGEPSARALRLRAWTCLGGARRLAGDPRGAREALEQAEPMLVEGEDLLEEAELHELAACLEADQGGLEAAERRLDRALALARGLGDRHLEGADPGAEGDGPRLAAGGGAGVARDRMAGRGGGPPGRGAGAGAPRLRAPSPRPAARARKRREQALPALQRARRLYHRLGDEPNLVRLRHLEGKIGEAAGRAARGRGRVPRRAAGFPGRRAGRRRRRPPCSTSRCSTRGRGAAPEIRPLAEDLLPIFRAPDLRQGVAAALLFFRRLVETEHADLEVLSEVARYVNDPPRESRPGLR